MKRYTVSELNKMMEKSNKIKLLEGSVNNNTRRGVYINILTGLSCKTIFIGVDLENNKDIIELVS